MDRFTFSGSKGEYCATCLSVLFANSRLVGAVVVRIWVSGEIQSRWAAKTHQSVSMIHLLVCNALK